MLCDVKTHCARTRKENPSSRSFCFSMTSSFLILYIWKDPWCRQQKASLGCLGVRIPTTRDLLSKGRPDEAKPGVCSFIWRAIPSRRGVQAHLATHGSVVGTQGLTASPHAHLWGKDQLRDQPGDSSEGCRALTPITQPERGNSSQDYRRIW